MWWSGLVLTHYTVDLVSTDSCSSMPKNESPVIATISVATRLGLSLKEVLGPYFGFSLPQRSCYQLQNLRKILRCFLELLGIWNFAEQCFKVISVWEKWYKNMSELLQKHSWNDVVNSNSRRSWSSCHSWTMANQICLVLGRLFWFTSFSVSHYHSRSTLTATVDNLLSCDSLSRFICLDCK